MHLISLNLSYHVGRKTTSAMRPSLPSNEPSINKAEQSLQALENISHEHPNACLCTRALMAMLSYLDFLSTSVQRVALSTTAKQKTTI